MEEISQEMAEDLGLLSDPYDDFVKVNGYSGLYPFETVVYSKKRQDMAENRYKRNCQRNYEKLTNKKLRTIEFDKKDIFDAIYRKYTKKENAKHWWQFWK